MGKHGKTREHWKDPPYKARMVEAMQEGYHRWLATPEGTEATLARRRWSNPESNARRIKVFRQWAASPEGQATLKRSAIERAYRPRTLTDEQVRAIRSTVAASISQNSAASLHDVSHGVVNQIIRGVTYKDVA